MAQLRRKLHNKTIKGTISQHFIRQTKLPQTLNSIGDDICNYILPTDLSMSVCCGYGLLMFNLLSSLLM